MAFAKEILGSSLIEKPSLIPSSRSLLFNHQQNRLRFTPVSVPLEKKVFRLEKAVKGPKATISENLVKAPAVEKPVKFKVRAVVTVRKNNKEDLREAIVKHIDALSEKIGRNVVLELVSTEIDPRSRKTKVSQAVLKDWLQKANLRMERVKYTAEFTVDSSFGVPGAITVSNKHQ